MISPAFLSYLIAIPCGVTAAVFVYDVKRAVTPRIVGEQRWRYRRAIATVGAVAAAALLHGGVSPLWLQRLEMAAFVLACVVVLGCSIPLKRLVEKSLQSRRLG